MNLMCPARILLLPGDGREAAVGERVAQVYAATFSAAAGSRLAEQLGVRLVVMPELTADPEAELQAIADQHRGETVAVLGIDLGLRLPAVVEHTGDGWTRVPTNNERTLAAYEQGAEQFRDAIPTEPNHQLIDLLDLPSGARVLEIGSGTGRDALELERRGFVVRRTDATEAFLEMMRADGHQADHLDALTDDFGGPYDAVFADAVFLHFDRALLPGVLSRAAYAAPMLAFSIINGQGEEWANRNLDVPRHFVMWTEEALREALAATGWSVARLERGAGKFGNWMQVLAVRS